MKKATIAERLKYIMKSNNLSQIDILNLAKKLPNEYSVKLTKSDLSQYISGKVEPCSSKITLLGKCLNVSETWLMGYDVPMNANNIPILQNNAKESFSDRLNKAMLKRNIKQVELCQLTGIPKSAMSQYINGKFEPKQDRIYLIANALNVSEAWLMGYGTPINSINNLADISIQKNNRLLIGQRIKEARKNLGYTQSDIAINLGMNKSTIQRYENGKIDNIKLPVIESMAKFLKVSSSWLSGESNIKERQHTIPLLGDIACGQPIIATEKSENYIEIDSNTYADFCLKAKDDSMINARIHDGDIVFIRSQPNVDNGDIAAVIIDNKIILKRVYKINSQMILMSENSAYKPLIYNELELKQIKILGKAIAFQSNIK